MKNLDLSSMGVQEMSALEMKETDGGFIGWVIAAAVALLIGTTTSCQTQVNVQIGGANNNINNAEQSADSTLNGNSVPIQY